MILKIKKSNNDSINQVRKINILNKQPICKITNHFTETEDSEYLNDIKNFNESKKMAFRHNESINNSCSTDDLNNNDIPIYGRKDENVDLIEDEEEILNNEETNSSLKNDNFDEVDNYSNNSSLSLYEYNDTNISGKKSDNYTEINLDINKMVNKNNINVTKLVKNNNTDEINILEDNIPADLDITNSLIYQ